MNHLKIFSINNTLFVVVVLGIEPVPKYYTFEWGMDHRGNQGRSKKEFLKRIEKRDNVSKSLE